MKDKWVPTKKEPYAPSKASDVYYTSLKRKVYPFVESIPKLNLPKRTLSSPKPKGNPYSSHS